MGAERIGVIVVDVQGDFTHFKNGSLAVKGTDEAYVRTVEKSTQEMNQAGLPIYATQDWHPASHISFYTSHEGKRPFDVIKVQGKDQVLWPPHCVQESPGAEILLDKKLIKKIIRKGMDPHYDSYSGFQDDGGKKTGMGQILKKDEVTKVVLYGLATDYCVRATALDATAAGYKVILIENLCRGVAADTTQKAIEEMKTRGVVILEDFDLEKIKAS